MLCNHANQNDTITSENHHGFLDNNHNNYTSLWQPAENGTMENEPDLNKTIFKAYNVTNEHVNNVNNVENHTTDYDKEVNATYNESDESHKSKISPRKGVDSDIDTETDELNNIDDDDVNSLKAKIKKQKSEIEFHKTVNYFLCLVLIVVVLLFCIVLIVFLLRRVRRERELGRAGCAVKCFDHLIEDANETNMFVYSGLENQEQAMQAYT